MSFELASRTPFAWLRERDIDLLLCSELHAGGTVTALLKSKVAPGNTEFLGAWVSHAEADGESDLVVSFSSPTGQIIALVENKIAAEFQPDQAQRYQARALRWSEMEGVERVVTLLFAPREYMDHPGAELFGVRLSYEDAADVLRTETDRRAVFLADALVAGIENYRRGYVMNPDENVSDMWMACWQLALATAPKLHFQKPELKPGRSTWFYFREAEGFSAEDRKRAVIVLKADRGQADLQFANTKSDVLHRRTQEIREGVMEVVSAAKSASIRILVPQIDFFRSADEQKGEILEGLNACERLRQFFCKYREHLVPD